MQLGEMLSCDQRSSKKAHLKAVLYKTRAKKTGLKVLHFCCDRSKDVKKVKKKVKRPLSIKKFDTKFGQFLWWWLYFKIAS